MAQESSKANYSKANVKGKSAKTQSAKTKGKKKRAAVVTPKLTNIQKPVGMTLVEWQVALRKQQATKDPLAISQIDEKFCPGEYQVKNVSTRSTYKVVYRGESSEWNYCSCLDFKTSLLGTCKHLEAVKLWLRDKRKKVHSDVPCYSSVYVDYKDHRCVKIRIGEENAEIMNRLAADYFDGNHALREDAYSRFDVFLQAAKAIDANFRCYDDALDLIIEKREAEHRKLLVDEKYTDAVLDSMLTVHLYPYQKEGIRFAVKAGKAIIADEMGLGKTIQAITSAEIYRREGMADSILVVCPTSLKYQWKKEIEKFTGGDTVCYDDAEEENGNTSCPKVIVVEGSPFKRRQLYQSRAPYKIVSYHTMCNDIREMGKITTDVLIMDEIQRLKNWDTLISRAARRIESRYAVLLSGTPMENKLEELYANMEFVDQFCLGPYYQFRNNHILLDPEKGSIVGYKELNAIGEQIKGRLIRRTKKGVQLQLPKRSDQYLLVPMTSRQAEYHSEFKWEVTKILTKYQKIHYMSEQDRKRLMLLLGQMRMVADSTFILEQNLNTRFDMKIAEVMNLLDNVFANGDEKVVIFSEWERMTRLVAIELEKRGIRYEYLNGRIPAKQRGQLVEYFNTLPESRVFISTDAGSTGLNLQVASILVNLDLPWNPAVLEQRIARIFRLGQEKPVQILNLVSKDSIEEGMIAKLRFKTSMFEGVLDGGADTVFISEDKFKKFMEDISCVINETPESPVVEYIDDVTEETPGVESADDKDHVQEQAAQKDASQKPAANEPAPNDGATSDTHHNDHNERKEGKTNGTPERTLFDEYNETEDETNTNVRKHESDANNVPEQPSTHTEASPTEPQQLISQGISFLSGLAAALKSPESTKQLVDSIVEVDKETGQANIKIPVANKDTVLQMLSLLGKLF